MIQYKIISTGSQGNAVVIENSVLIDCGVSFKTLRPYYKSLKLVLLTHIHTDHLKFATIRALARERPTLRFGCCKWLVDAVVTCGVSKYNIDVLQFDKMYEYGICNIIPIPLVHNVPNCGYKLHFPTGKVIYATDTNNMNGIVAKDYDLYLIEANYEDEQIREKIKTKQEFGEYAYELQVIHNHLSKAKCDDFIYRNIGSNGTYTYLHCHKEGDGEPDDCYGEDTQI